MHVTTRKKTTLLRWIALGLVGIVAATALRAAFDRNFRNDLWLYAAIVYADITKPNDPVTRHIRNDPSREWGHKVSLLPRPFAMGTSRSEVLKQLVAARYESDPDETFSLRHPEPIPPGGLHFSMSADEFPCQILYDVVVRFDASDRLIDAYGAQEETGCL
jgi:hypothetical protein